MNTGVSRVGSSHRGNDRDMDQWKAGRSEVLWCAGVAQVTRPVGTVARASTCGI